MAKLIDAKFVADFIPKRDETVNKGSFGRILNIAGSKIFSGAAFLSSKSALKVGAGFITLACLDDIIPRIAPALPEIVYYPLLANNEGSISNNNTISDLYNYDVISIGCGLTTSLDTQKFVIKMIKEFNSRQKIVIDADAINTLALHKGELSIKNSIITPHPKELARLLNVELSDVLDNREKYARISAQTYECITILKGHNTIVTNGDKIFVNTTGNSALAKAGTGDVLTGMISGFLSQNVKPLDAALLSVFLHGLSGDIASDDLTKYSVLASDVIEYIPFALQEIIEKE